MIIGRRALHTVLAGGFAAAFLGLGVSAKTQTHLPGQSSGGKPRRVHAPTTANVSFSGYEIAAGDDLLVAASPTHLSNARAGIVPAAGPGPAEGAGRSVEPRRLRPTRGILPEGVTPAQESADDAAAAESGSFVTLPTDFTLASGASSLVVTSRYSLEANDRTGLFPVVAAGSGPDDFQPNPGGALGLGLGQTVDPAAGLYRAPVAPLPSADTQAGLADGRWALP